MNWLAHLVLSGRSAAFRIGNLLPDLMTKAELAAVSDDFQQGINCHRRIDVFTNAHPVVSRSTQRLSRPHRRFSPILIDIFYDHFLSTQWPRHWTQPLDEFLSEIYGSFDEHRAQLPETTYGYLERMRAENWLGSYGEITGVQLTLERISRRLRRRVELGEAARELVQHYEALEGDFNEFFPELRAHVNAHFPNARSLPSP